MTCVYPGCPKCGMIVHPDSATGCHSCGHEYGMSAREFVEGVHEPKDYSLGLRLVPHAEVAL